MPSAYKRKWKVSDTCCLVGALHSSIIPYLECWFAANSAPFCGVIKIFQFSNWILCWWILIWRSQKCARAVSGLEAFQMWLVLIRSHWLLFSFGYAINNPLQRVPPGENKIPKEILITRSLAQNRPADIFYSTSFLGIGKLWNFTALYKVLKMPVFASSFFLADRLLCIKEY